MVKGINKMAYKQKAKGEKGITVVKPVPNKNETCTTHLSEYVLL